jgi:hypothetical protein
LRLHIYRRLVVVLAATTALAGCGNPYALKTSNLNYDAPQRTGSIRFTDPKLYKRELLINERRREIDYLDELLVSSKTQLFTPEIIRELEVISALSASLGLRVDPAAGLNYRRDREVSDIQQEIAVLRLQAELDRLKHESELFRRQLATQQAVTDTTLGSSTTPSVPNLSSSVTAASAAQLTQTITTLQTNLQGRIDAAKAASASAAAVNPLDLYQDRAAYRSLLNSAKNAASLDELHDKDGSALVRLYFSATVLPPERSHRDTLGVLRMQVVPPDLRRNYDHVAYVYKEWLGFVNATLNRVEKTRNGPKFAENSAFVALVGTGDLFDLISYDFSMSDVSAGCRGLSAAELKGLAFFNDAGCQRLLFAVPRPDSLIRGRDHETTLATIESALRQNPGEVQRDISLARSAIRGDLNGTLLDDRCRVDLSSTLANTVPPGSRLSVLAIIEQAMHVLFLAETYSGVELHARKILSDANVPQPPLASALELLAPLNAEARRLMDDLIELGQLRTVVRGGEKGSCTLLQNDFVRAYVPVRFIDAVTKPDVRVAVYEVGPREQVQQVSTTARAAEAISLAAAVAGQVPSQGLSGDGNIAYARSAIGKADARERVPVVASFAEPGGIADGRRSLPAFGWLLGPRMTLDPAKQKLRLEQQIKPYDLSVDLSVPGWWPYLYLDAETAWAPNWRDGSGRTVAAGTAKPHRIKVELGPNSADYSALTALLSGTSSIRFPSIASVSPGSVSACSTDTQLQIFGDNIWRASTVVVGGRKFDGAAVSVLPDMSGVLVSLNAVKLPAVDGEEALISVLTPYGAATHPLTVKTPAEACDPPKAAEKPPSTAPTITSLSSPELSICVSAPVFTIRGTNLKDLESVSLGAIEGKAAEAPPKNGTEVEAKFPDIKRGNLQGMTTVPLTLRTKQGSATAKVTIVSPVSCG